MKVGDLLSLPVSSLAYGGDVVGRMGDFVVFVSGGLPGEECRVGLREVHRHYALAEVEAITTSSPDRVVPPCPVFGACGGCQWQMLSYPAQLRAKSQLVTEALERIGGLKDPQVEPTVGMDDPWRFRNKAQFPVSSRDGKVAMGYYRRGTHEVVEFEACAIQGPALDRVRNAFKALWETHRLPVYDERSRAPGLRHIVARVGQGTGEVLVMLVLSRGSVPAHLIEEARKALPEMVGLALNHNSRPGNVILGERFTLLWGRGHFFETIAPLRLKVSAGSFFQTNSRQTEALYRKASEMAGLSGRERVVDLYSGVGGIALFLAPQAQSVLGIEEVTQAHRDACENKALNRIRNVEFRCGRAEQHLYVLGKAEVLIADPPRSGCSMKVLSAIARSEIRRLVYVSCNPTTLARDIQFLCSQGFRLSRVVPVDLFPHSFHVETVARLDR
jgi:23S rRNA (uracil1939-C5)-methyltransferase